MFTVSYDPGEITMLFEIRNAADGHDVLGGPVSRDNAAFMMMAPVDGKTDPNSLGIGGILDMEGTTPDARLPDGSRVRYKVRRVE